MKGGPAEGPASTKEHTSSGRSVRPAAFTDDLHRLLARSGSEVAWVDGTRRNVRLRLSPIDVGPAMSAALWGEVTAVLTSATVPPFWWSASAWRDLKPVSSTWGAHLTTGPTRPLTWRRHLPDRASPCRPSGAPQGARPVDRRGRRPDFGPVHQSASHRGGGGALAEELPFKLLPSGRACQGRGFWKSRRRRDLSACSPRSASGKASTPGRPSPW